MFGKKNNKNIIDDDKIDKIIDKLIDNDIFAEKLFKKLDYKIVRRTLISLGIGSLLLGTNIADARTIITDKNIQIDKDWFLKRPGDYDFLISKDKYYTYAYDNHGEILAKNSSDKVVFSEVFSNIDDKSSVKINSGIYYTDIIVKDSKVTISGTGKSVITGKIIAFGETEPLDGVNTPVEYLKVDNLILGGGIYFRHNVNDFVITRCIILGEGLFVDAQAINGLIAFNHFRSQTYNINFTSKSGDDGTRAEGNKIVCNYIDGWFKCEGIYFYNSRNNIVGFNVLDNYYDIPVTFAGNKGLGHHFIGNVILVPNSDTVPAILIDESQKNTVVLNYITQANVGIHLKNTTNNTVGFNTYLNVNTNVYYDNSPKDVIAEFDNIISMNGLINKFILSGDYGGNFASFTPPEPVAGLCFLAKDTNAFAPATRLYWCIDGVNWEYSDMRTKKAYVVKTISLSPVPGNAEYGTPYKNLFSRPLSFISNMKVLYNVATGDIVYINLGFIFQDNTVGTEKTVTIDNSAGTTNKTGSIIITTDEMYVMIESSVDKEIVGVQASAKSENGTTTVEQNIMGWVIQS